MVQKIKPKRGAKPGHAANKSKDKKEASKDASVQSIFKELNDPLYKRGYVQSETMYEFYIVSRAWLRKFRRAAKEGEEQEFDVINADLLAHNVYAFDARRVDETSNPILRNSLALDDDYEAVTDEAWNVLTTVAECVPIRKSFYVNENFDFVDMDDSLFVNVIFIDAASEAHKVMLCMSKPRRLENYYANLLQHFKAEPSGTGFYLFDTRKSIKEFDAAQKNSILLAKLVDTSVYFPYAKLKDHDVLVMCADGRQYALSAALDENEGGYCYNCRDCTNLYYHCSCGTVSYCCIECKYSDFLFHRAFCDDIGAHAADVATDLRNFDAGETNDGMVGLRNIGNSCYLNCLLQAMKYNELIRTHLSSRDPQFVAGQSPLTNALYHFFYVVWHSRRASIRPWLLKIALGLKHKDYLYFEQNDAHECLMNVIDEIHEVPDPMYKAIAESFRGRLTSRIACGNCPKEILKHESFYSLSLPLVEEKMKVKLTLNRVSDADFLSLSQSELVVSSATRISKLAGDDERAVLYLADQDKIVHVAESGDGDLSRTLAEAREARAQDAFLMLQRVPRAHSGGYLGVAYTESKPTANKFMDMKAKVCRMRLMPFCAPAPDAAHVSGQDVKVAVLKQLLQLGGDADAHGKALEQLDSANVALRHRIAAKLLNYEAHVPQPEKPAYPKKYMYKVERARPDAGGAKPDEFEFDKPAYEAAVKAYEEEYKRFVHAEQDQLTAAELAKGALALPAELQFEVFYTNRAETCLNCGKKMKHQCKFKPDARIPFGAGRLLEVNVEFPKNSPLALAVKELTRAEADTRPLNLSSQKPELSLRSCLNAFFSAEQIEFKCEECACAHSTIRTEVDVHPDTLVVHLKRFATVFADNKVKQVKNEQVVDFEHALDLNGHAYSLVSIINHRGEINHGHYTSFAYNDNVGAWALYDDEDVRLVEAPEHVKSKENYILLFKLNKPKAD